MNQFETEQAGPQPSLEEIARRIETGEGEISPDDLRRVAKSEEVPERLRWIVDLAATLLEQRESWGRDALTGLMTSSRFEQTLEGAFGRYQQNPEERLTLVLFDIDHLKEANSAGEGHEGGNKLLKTFTSELIGVFGEKTDMIARWLVGDEFMVALRGGDEVAVELKEKFEQKLKEVDVSIGDKKFSLSAAGVVCEIDPQDGLSGQMEKMSRELIQIKKAAKDEKE